jgi:hypothetical protein
MNCFSDPPLLSVHRVLRRRAGNAGPESSFAAIMGGGGGNGAVGVGGGRGGGKEEQEGKEWEGDGEWKEEA